MDRITSEEAHESFSRFVNGGYGAELDNFAKLVTSDHKALQADYFSVMLKCIGIWHDMYKNGIYDGRNMYELKLAYEIIESLKDKKLY